jgi:hypothetical protein
MRGIGFEVEEMMKLFLVLIIGLVVVIIIIGASGGIKQLLDDFCARNPNICSSSSIQDLNMARASTDALVRAINCVSDPTTCKCTSLSPCIFNAEDYSESLQSSSTPSLSGKLVTGFQTVIKTQSSKTSEVKCNNQIVGVTCDCTYTYGGRAGSLRTQITSTTRDQALADCKAWLLSQGLAEQQILPQVFCSDKAITSCTVNNFQLPQKVGNIQEWIDGLGDPQYLVFWQKFPEGEDASWKSESTWFAGAGKVMFGLMCASRALTTIFFPTQTMKMTAEVVKDAAPKAVSKVSGILSKVKSVEGSIPSLTRVADDIYPGVVTYESGGTKTAILSWLKSTASKVVSSETVSKSFIVFLKAVPRTAAYSGLAAAAAVEANKTVAEAAYRDARLETELGKFIEQPNKLVLQQPLLYKSNVENSIDIKPIEQEASISDPQKQNIVKLGRPVMLNKASTILGIKYDSTMVPLYFASPCQADLKVDVAQTACESYSYDVKTGKTNCEKPDTTWTIGQLKCGTLYTNIKQDSGKGIDFISKEKDFISNMNAKMTFQTDSTGVTIYDPINDITSHATFNPEIVCCDSSNKKEWQLKDNCVSFLQGNVIDDSQCSSPKPTNKVILNKISSKGVDKSITVKAADGTEGSKCIKVESLTGIDKEILGSAENVYFCSFAAWTGGSVYGSMNPANPRATFIANMKDNGEIDKFYAIWIQYGDDSPYTMVVLKDNNNDGYIDELDHYYWIGGQETQLSRMFKDTDNDGKVDSVSSSKCFVDGIVVSVDKSAYKNDKDNPNFCYTGKSPVVSIGTTVGMFLVDSIAKRIPSPYTFFASMVADCGLAYISYKYETINWPYS